MLINNLFWQFTIRYKLIEDINFFQILLKLDRCNDDSRIMKKVSMFRIQFYTFYLFYLND